MKFIIDKDKYIIYKLDNNFDIDNLTKDDLERKIKKILFYIKKKYCLNISGFYDVTMYINKNYGLILEISKESNLDFFPDLVDINLKIINNFDIYLEFEDYFLINKYHPYYYKNNYYIDIVNLDNKDLLRFSDFYKIKYGDELNKIKNKFRLVN